MKNVDASDAVITGKTIKSLCILFSSSKKGIYEYSTYHC